MTKSRGRRSWLAKALSADDSLEEEEEEEEEEE